MNIQGYDNYLIYPDGRVYNKKLNRELKATLNNRGYYVVNLTENKNRKLYLLHRLIALHYISNPDNKHCIDHIDRDKTNNSLDNLRWVTQQENCQNWTIGKRNTTGHSNIKIRKTTGNYTFSKMIKGEQHSRTFKTLEEAVEYKTNYLSTEQPPLPHHESLSV